MNEIETIYDHIDLEYKHLDEIRKNITYLTRRMSGFHNYTRFTNNSSDARMMIDTYTQLYGVIVNHIEYLYEKANSFLNRRNINRPSESIVYGNYAFINGRYYHLDNIQNMSDTGNSLNRDNTRGRENSNEQTSDNSPFGTNRTDNVNTRSTRSPTNIRRSEQPTRIGQTRSIWNAPTANISRETNLFGTPPTPSLDNLFQHVNNMNSPNNIRWPQIPITTPNNPFQALNNRNAFDSITTEFFRTFSEPVHVSPSADQIRAATVTLAYSELHEPINHQCPISLELFQPTSIVTQIRYCRHAFMPSSFQTWFQSNVRCPICRHDIRENIPSETQETTFNSEHSHSSTSATADTQENEEETNQLNDLPPLIPIEEEGEASNDIEMGPQPERPPPVPEPMPEPPEPQNTRGTTNTTHTQDEDFTTVVETMLNEAVRNMLDDPSGNQQPGSNIFLPPLNLNTNAIGTAIFNNIMNHNYQNVEFDPSNNAVRFETTVFDSSWNAPG